MFKNNIILIILAFTAQNLFSQTDNSKTVQKMVFEEKRIEGKIRRPQLVLIQADQRPNFEPMILQSIGSSASIVQSVDRSIVDSIPNKQPFKFDGTRIINIIP